MRYKKISKKLLSMYFLALFFITQIGGSFLEAGSLGNSWYRNNRFTRPIRDAWYMDDRWDRPFDDYWYMNDGWDRPFGNSWYMNYRFTSDNKKYNKTSNNNFIEDNKTPLDSTTSVENESSFIQYNPYITFNFIPELELDAFYVESDTGIQSIDTLGQRIIYAQNAFIVCLEGVATLPLHKNFGLDLKAALVALKPGGSWPSKSLYELIALLNPDLGPFNPYINVILTPKLGCSFFLDFDPLIFRTNISAYGMITDFTLTAIDINLGVKLDKNLTCSIGVFWSWWSFTVTNQNKIVNTPLKPAILASLSWRLF